MGMLSRLGFGRPAGPFSYDRRYTTLAAVAENLRLVLNTKEGYGWFLPGFGLGNYVASPAAGETEAVLADEILANVRRFEPRLVDPELAVLGRDASWIELRLTGRIDGRPAALDIRFHASFGTVEVCGDGR